MSKSDNVPKTRRNGSKKKAKPAATTTTAAENESNEPPQQAETETLKEKPKKKKARKPKKKVNHEDDKENVVPHESTATSKSADTADPKHSETGNENATKSSKKANGKKKKAPATREPLSEVSSNQELEQGEYSIDYQSLHDALRGPFTLDDKRGPIYFAPLTNKIKHQQHEKASPKFSYSTSATGDASRNSNTSSPSAKSKINPLNDPLQWLTEIHALDRHAEIPPPAFLTTEKLGKKKKAAKTANNEKSTIAKIKETKAKPSKKTTSTAHSEEDASAAILETKKPVEKTKSNDGKKQKAITTLGAPVKPVVFVKEEKKKTTVISAKKTSQVTQDERKRENKEIKKGMKHHDQEDYCHPNDIIHNTKTGRVRFERYLDPKICHEKVDQGLLYKGVLRISKRSRSDAYVTCDNLDSDIFINGQHDRNRALDGDTVIVELLDLESVWAKKKESMVQKREQRHSTAAERPPQDEGQDDKGKPKYVGKVVAITATNKNQVCSGILSIHRNAPAPVKMVTQENETDTNTPAEDEEDDSNETANTSDNNNNNKHIRLVWFKPTDTRKPMIAIQLKHAPADILKNEEKYKNLLMVAKITRWPIDSTNPFGTVLRELGHIGNIVAETQAVLEDNGIVEQPFGQKALKGLPDTPWSISQAEIDKRRDLRDTRIFTIDPATAKDLDDAVHVTKLAEDEFEIGVHIADVSHFVHQHTALDHEAFDRGTSTYLCDRVIPMLPALLCEQLCSLNPGVERLAFSVIWKMDGAGNIKDTWFGKSVIK